MSDLRAKVEALAFYMPGDHIPYMEASLVLALIPEGAVLVTEEDLGEAASKVLHFKGDDSLGEWYGEPDDLAAAIIAKLREGK